MSLRHKRKELHGLIGGIGVVALLGGFVGEFYSGRSALVFAFGTWIIGATLVNALTDKK